MHKPILCEGGGFSSFWYCLGKLSDLKAKGEFESVDGFSSGAIVATISICMDEIKVSKILLASIKSKAFDLSHTVYRILDNLLPPNAHLIANKKLGIIICDPYTHKAIVIREWATRERLIECVVASTYIPHISGTTCVDPRV